jgi:UPF0755 protein
MQEQPIDSTFVRTNSNLGYVDPDKNKFPIGAFVIVLIFLGALMFGFYIHTAPKNFPSDNFVRVEKGDTLFSVSKKIRDQNYIRSARLFQAYVIFFGKERKIIAGDYYFTDPVSVINIAKRFADGNFNTSQIKITLPEGISRKEMVGILSKSLPNISFSDFMNQTKEGYLFPDTYFFSPFATLDDIVSRLNGNFESKIKTLEKDFKNTDKTKEEIIIMASILEKEASSKDDAHIISGILWKRISIGMPMQADATFLYILGKGSSELTKSDLKVNSPYNTYTNKGLPPGPIGNPGINMILSAIYPTSSEYLYYLHGDDGKTYFAKSYDEHLKNKRRYIK